MSEEVAGVLEIQETRKLSERIAPVIEEALELASMGEDLYWELIPMVMPTASGPVPTMMFFVYAKSPLIGGEGITASVVAGQPLKLLDPVNAKEMVRQAVATVMEQRSKILSGQ